MLLYPQPVAPKIDQAVQAIITSSITPVIHVIYGH